MPEGRLVRDDEPVLNDPCIGLRERVPQGPPALDLGGQRALRIRAESGKRQVSGRGSDENVRRLEPGQAGISPERLLLQLPVRRRVDIRADPERRTRDAQMLDELGRLVRAEDGEPDLPLRRRGPARISRRLPQAACDTPRRRLVVDEQARAKDVPGLLVTAVANEVPNKAPELVRSEV